MNINLLRQYLANKAPKKNISEASVPPAIRKYVETPYSQHTYGTAYDAGSEVASHPAVQKYLEHVKKTMPSGSRKENEAYVKAVKTLPADVASKVAKDYGINSSTVYAAYSAYTSD